MPTKEEVLKEALAHLEGDRKTWLDMSDTYENTNPTLSSKAKEEAINDERLIYKIREVVE